LDSGWLDDLLVRCAAGSRRARAAPESLAGAARRLAQRDISLKQNSRLLIVRVAGSQIIPSRNVGAEDGTLSAIRRRNGLWMNLWKLWITPALTRDS
jgi:hypothetical protein